MVVQVPIYVGRQKVIAMTKMSTNLSFWTKQWTFADAIFTNLDCRFDWNINFRAIRFQVQNYSSTFVWYTQPPIVSLWLQERNEGTWKSTHNGTTVNKNKAHHQNYEIQIYQNVTPMQYLLISIKHYRYIRTYIYPIPKNVVESMWTSNFSTSHTHTHNCGF